jgi:hypothetical protein
MTTKLACVVMITTALAGSAASAQANDAGGRDSASTNQPVHKAIASPAEQTADGFVTKQAMTEWRAPKLVGVSVYRPDDKKVGTIKDILIDHDGSARVIVIGVGGFLGIGSKDIGVPFTAVQWRTEGRAVPTDQPPANPITRPVGDSAATPAMKKTDPSATEASQGYPDKAILNLTLEQLKSAPDFKYAPDPLAELESSPAGPRPTNQ